MKFDDEICKGVSCHECSFNKGEDGCLLAERLDEIDITPEPCEEHTETHSCDCEHTETHDSVSRQSVIDSVCEVCENCEYFKNEKLIQTIKDLPSAQPRWIPVTPETLPNLNSVVVVCGKKGTWLGINQEEGQDD